MRVKYNDAVIVYVRSKSGPEVAETVSNHRGSVNAKRLPPRGDQQQVEVLWDHAAHLGTMIEARDNLCEVGPFEV